MKWVPGYFNDIGFFITFLGFVITIWQILILKSRQKEIKEATTAAVERLSTFDNAIHISRAKESIKNLKSLVMQGLYSLIDPQIPELKEQLHHCKRICPEYGGRIESLLFDLSSIQSRINEILLNPANKDFESGFFCAILDETRDIFAEAIENCKN